jgi:hypothetical protein
MSPPTTITKIADYIEKLVLTEEINLVDKLKEGNFQEFEQYISQAMTMIQNQLSESIIKKASEELYAPLVESAREAGCRRIEKRTLRFRLSTGYSINVPSPYIKTIPKDWTGTRHLLEAHWKIIEGASPGLYDRVGFYTALSPSYEMSHLALAKAGTSVSKSSVRDISNRLATHCYQYGEEKLMLKPGETLAGKRVLISLDGGRTRMRHYNGKKNKDNHAKYDTDWSEPKMFVIDVLDEDGQPDGYCLPIYGCRFSDEDVLGLLERYMKALEIEKAKSVQVIADGATWIWNNLKPLLMRMGVSKMNITETLDYYHASHYVHQIVDNMPARITAKKREDYLVQFKEWLWNGQSKLIVDECRKLFKRPSQLVTRWINYIEKHQDKTQYTTYEKQKLMCGSGIIESGIRRIINLRFKNAATFWDKNTVEKLYCLRAALLSKRWDTFIRNIN